MRANAAEASTQQVNWLTANQHFFCDISFATFPLLDREPPL